MAQVALTVNSRTYTVTCGDGEEGRLIQLARYLDHKVTQLVRQEGQAGEPLLLLMAGLLVVDELSDTRDALYDARNAGAITAPAPPEPAQPAGPSPEEIALAQSLDQLAQRIEAIAATLEQD